MSDYMTKRGLTIVKAFILLLPKWSSHGPAFKQAYFRIFNVDVVVCSRCYSSWPVVLRNGKSENDINNGQARNLFMVYVTRDSKSYQYILK